MRVILFQHLFYFILLHMKPHLIARLLLRLHWLKIGDIYAQYHDKCLSSIIAYGWEWLETRNYKMTRIHQMCSLEGNCKSQGETNVWGVGHPTWIIGHTTHLQRLCHRYRTRIEMNRRRRRGRKCNDLKCVRKPTKSRLSLTHHANKSSRWAE